MTCKYKVKIKDIQYNYKVQMTDIQSKYKFKVFCTGYDDSEIKEKIDAMYQAWPKVSGEGETITLNDTANTTMAIDLKGNTIQDGEPTPDTPIPIKVVSGDNTIKVEGKNLLKYPYLNTTSTVSGVTFTDNGDGSITIDGTSTSSTYFLWFIYENAWNYNKLSFELNPGTYTFKGLTTNKVTMACNFYFSDNSNEYFLIEQNDVTKTITNKVKLNMRILVKSGTTVDNVTIYPQIEVGSSSSSFEPYNGNTYPIYLGNIELCKIGNYKDRIYPLNGKWYLNKQIGKVVLNGSENWSILTATHDNFTRFSFQSNIQAYIVSTSLSSTYGICNRFSKLETSSSTSTENQLDIRNTGLAVINTNVASTIADFKTWLGNNNVILYYVLATPETVEITDTTLISQLNALAEAESYSGQTNISQVNNDKPFIITAKALKDLSSLGTSTVSTLNTASVNRLGTPVLNQSIDPVNLELNSEDLELNNEEEAIEETPEER